MGRRLTVCRTYALYMSCSFVGHETFNLRTLFGNVQIIATLRKTECADLLPSSRLLTPEFFDSILNPGRPLLALAPIWRKAARLLYALRRRRWNTVAQIYQRLMQGGNNHEAIRAYSPSWDCMQDLQTSGITRFAMRVDLLTDFGLRLAFTLLNL